MIDFEYQNQTRLVFGRDAIERLGEQAAATCDSRVAMMVHSGHSTWEEPYFKQATASLTTAGFEVVELAGVVPNPRLSLVRQGVELAKKHKVGIVIGLGGGSSIDTAKAVAAGALFEGDVWELFEGAEFAENLPVGAVATIAATGSEASIFSVITNDETLAKWGIGWDSLRPTFAIMNPETTYTLPAYQTACGAADIMAHAMDTYFGDTEPAEFQHMLLEAVVKTVVRYAPIALKTPDDYEARAQLMLAGNYAMAQELGVGHSTNLAPHEIGEYLGGLYDVTHGAVLAVLEPSCLAEVAAENPQRIERFGREIFGVEGVEATLDALRAFYSSCGLPATLKDLGIDFAADREKLRGQVGEFDGPVYQPYNAEAVDRILERVAG